MVITATHDEKVLKRLGELELTYTRVASPTKPELELEETQTEALKVPETQHTRENNDIVHEGTTYGPPSDPNTMLDRIRKWNVGYDGGKDPIQFVQRVEELSGMPNIQRYWLPRAMPELLQGQSSKGDC